MFPETLSQIMHVRSHAPDPKRSLLQIALLTVFVCALLMVGHRTTEPTKVEKDVIYGHKFGTALTMDIYKPPHPNGAAILWIVSGGWYSDHNALNEETVTPLLKHGYTVFAVTHGSTPRYTILDISEDIVRAARFVRHNLRHFNISAAKLGVIGVSSGGHLSMLLGTRPIAANPKAADPVDQESSKVDAVVAFAPPSDFLNYGGKGKNAFDGVLKPLSAAAAFQEWDDKSNTFVRITDPAKVRQNLVLVSPIYSVTSDDAPTLIFHGDADEIVPFQQSENLIKTLTHAKVPAVLVREKGVGHDFGGNIQSNLELAAHWYDRYLLNKE